MDNNADRIPYFWFYQYLGENTTAKIVAVSQEKNKVSGRISDILEDDTVLMFHNQHNSRYFELVCIAKESEPDPLRYTVWTADISNEVNNQHVLLQSPPGWCMHNKLSLFRVFQVICYNF